VGLPEYMADFNMDDRRPGLRRSWTQFWKSKTSSRPELSVISGGSEMMKVAIPEERRGWRAGFPIAMRLPSFSGYNKYEKNLLTYSLDLKSRLSLIVPGCEVQVPKKSPLHELLRRRPLISLCFEKLRMDVEAPTKHDPALTFKNVPFKFLQKQPQSSSSSSSIQEQQPKGSLST